MKRVCSKCGSSMRFERKFQNQNYWRILRDGTKEPRKGEKRWVVIYRCDKCPAPKPLSFSEIMTTSQNSDRANR